MKKSNLIIGMVLAAGLLMSSCTKNFPVIYGKGEIVTEYLDVNDFSRIHAEGTNNIHFTYGEVQEVKVVGHANIIDRILTNVSNDTWNIRLENGSYGNYELTYYITIPRIERIENEGTCTITIDEFIDQDYLEIDLDGTGGFYGFNMKLNECNIDIEGLGKCEVWVEDVLNVNIKGSGRVLYKGDPEVHSNISGTGSIIDKN